MAVKFVDLDDSYVPQTSTENIIVDVEIGDGQVGAYSIFLGKKHIKSNSQANLGKKADVSGKKILISVTVIDTLKETNWTSMSVFVTEGDQTIQYGPYKVMAENHLDTIIYTLKLINA